YEVLVPGGSVEHMNEEAGKVWLSRVTTRFPHVVWLNPNPLAAWEWTESTRLIRQLMDGRMYPLTLEGLDAATKELMR
ncbi:MAG: VWA domain-containing protein, partial [Hyphomicrobiaceae bacterium]|nr:VWA domain-containing protein [Hyphomicrobiaceae bacterium]